MEPAVYALLGLVIILAHWLPRFVSRRDPVATPLLIAGGLLIGLLQPSLAYRLNPLGDAKEWTLVTEVTVTISLFGAGLMIDSWGNRRAWTPAVRLLAIAMPLCIAAVALLGWWAAGLPLAAALLLGAMLAPTDPVLAGGVQVGKPLEGGEDPARLTLATEAGLNDGLAFPFVHLALAVAAAGAVGGGLLADWALNDVAWKIGVGVAAGVGIGWLLGKVLFDWPGRNALADTESGVVALAAVLLTYGATEMLHGYGFIAVFVAGIVVRHSEGRHHFNRTLHSFTENVEMMLTALILLALGATLPVLWQYMDWAGLAIAAALVLVIRPVAGWVALAGVKVRRRERAVMAFYGVRGVGSIYYCAYALGKGDFGADEGRLWAILAMTIILSTLVHGLTGELAVERATEGVERELGGDAVAMKPTGEG